MIVCLLALFFVENDVLCNGDTEPTIPTLRLRLSRLFTLDEVSSLGMQLSHLRITHISDEKEER